MKPINYRYYSTSSYRVIVGILCFFLLIGMGPCEDDITSNHQLSGGTTLEIKQESKITTVYTDNGESSVLFLLKAPSKRTVKLQITFKDSNFVNIPGVTFTPDTIKTIGDSGPGYQYTTNQYEIDFKVTADTNTAFGDYQLRGRSVDAAADYSKANFVLRVLPAGSGDPLTISVAPQILSIIQGSSGSALITLTKSVLITEPVTLSAEGLPPGVTASFSTNPLAGTVSDLIFDVDSTAAQGTYNLTLRASANGFQATTEFELKIVVNSLWGFQTFLPTSIGFFSVAFGSQSNGIAVGISRNARTFDGGNSWELFTHSSNLFDVVAIDANTYVACGIDSNIIRSTDIGVTWTEAQINSQTGYDAFYGISFAPENSQIGTVVGPGGGGQVLWSTDGGLNWASRVSPAAYLASDYLLDDISHWDMNTALILGKQTNAAGGLKVILKTTDGGNTWSEKTITGYFYSIKCISNGYAIAVGTESKIIRSTDYGETWNTINPPKLNCDFRDVSFVNENIGTIVGRFLINSSQYNPVILRTVNGGATWFEESVPNPTFPAFLDGVQMLTEEKVIAVGNKIIYKRN